MTTVDTLQKFGHWVSPIRIDDAVVDSLCEASDMTVRHVSAAPTDSSSRVVTDGDGVAYVRRVGKLWARSAVFAEFMASQQIMLIAEDAIGGCALPVNAQLVIKHARETQGIDWHFDPDPPGKLRPPFDYVIGVYLDHSTVANGALRVVEGSHLWTLADRREWIRSHRDSSTSSSTGDPISLYCAAGTVCLHERGIIHGSPPNTTYTQRRTVYLHYRSEQMLRETKGPDYVDRLRESLASVSTSGSSHDI